MTPAAICARLVHVFNAHLGTGHLERRKRATRLLDLDLLKALDISGPRIMLGDFNEWTQSVRSAVTEPGPHILRSPYPSRERAFSPEPFILDHLGPLASGGGSVGRSFGGMKDQCALRLQAFAGAVAWVDKISSRSAWVSRCCRRRRIGRVWPPADSFGIIVPGAFTPVRHTSPPLANVPLASYHCVSSRSRRLMFPESSRFKILLCVLR
jgi:hypothetical protein